MLGLNAVTRGLEKGEISVVVVCKGPQHSFAISHLPYLCHMKKTPLMPINDSPETFAKFFGLSHLLALGFKV